MTEYEFTYKCSCGTINTFRSAVNRSQIYFCKHKNCYDRIIINEDAWKKVSIDEKENNMSSSKKRIKEVNDHLEDSINDPSCICGDIAQELESLKLENAKLKEELKQLRSIKLEKPVVLQVHGQELSFSYDTKHHNLTIKQQGGVFYLQFGEFFADIMIDFFTNIKEYNK